LPFEGIIDIFKAVLSTTRQPAPPKLRQLRRPDASPLHIGICFLSNFVTKYCAKFVNKTNLTLQYLFPGNFNTEPFSPVYLGELGLPPRLGGPFHGEGVASHGIGIAVSLKCPGHDPLSARLPKCDKFADSPFASNPVSSKNSRFAVSKGSSLSEYSPLGIDHTPGSFFAQ
jgi:hypothetical protein